jgi:hypothetical protein
MLVQGLLENLACLEGEHAPFGDLDWLPSLRIAPRALALVSQDEVAKSAHLYLLAPSERLFDHLEDEVYEFSGLFSREAANLAIEGLDDLRFGHERRSPPKRSEQRV